MRSKRVSIKPNAFFSSSKSCFNRDSLRMDTMQWLLKYKLSAAGFLGSSAPPSTSSCNSCCDSPVSSTSSSSDTSCCSSSHISSVCSMFMAVSKYSCQCDKSEHKSALCSKSLVTPPSTHWRKRLCP